MAFIEPMHRNKPTLVGDVRVGINHVDIYDPCKASQNFPQHASAAKQKL